LVDDRTGRHLDGAYNRPTAKILERMDLIRIALRDQERGSRGQVVDKVGPFPEVCVVPQDRYGDVDLPLVQAGKRAVEVPHVREVD
jgi:hypothetical protein